ncbi:MAG TPA: amidohydrolase family protein [Acidimicrobiia bacterium]|nr:amidohydrolase family protein [Acidimicrobiia bacterium]
MLSDGQYVIDAWVQPWTVEVAAGMPRRDQQLAEKYGNARRLNKGITLGAMVAEMDAAGVDKALCSAGPLIPNVFVIEALEAYPDRFIGVATADPWGEGGVMAAVRTLRHMVLDHGCVGLKLEPFINDRLLTEAGWYPLYAACVDLDVTVQVQVGQSGAPSYVSETGRPTYVDRVAVDFPDLRIVAGHIGWPWTDEMIAVAQKHDNVWIDTSAHQPRYYPPTFVHFLRTFGRHKVLWGSDWPILDFDRALAGTDDLDLSADGRAAFFAGNAAAAFKLDLPPAATNPGGAA